MRLLTEISTGHNDSNPVWSPSGEMIAFERSVGDRKEIVVARFDGTILQKIYYRTSGDEDEMTFFFPGIIEDTSYNAGLSWSPDGSRIVFMSNGGSGNYDLYLLSSVGTDEVLRLTESPEKDSHPHWSPSGDRLVFVSGRTGSAEIFMLDLSSGIVHQLSRGSKTFLYPQWSPNGKKIAMIYGSSDNHDIYVIEDLQNPFHSVRKLTTWQYDDLRPVWSPDGTKIAFYSNFNPTADPKIWSIIVLDTDKGIASLGEDELASRVVATNVVPDIERGPAWMPDSKHIVYVSNDRKDYHPIYIVQVQAKTVQKVNTGTKMNHDVVCSSSGILAFRAQTEQWDHIYLTRLHN